jgi:hypothetical protein
MSRFSLPPAATSALALGLAVLAVVAAGCSSGGGGGHHAATATTGTQTSAATTSVAACKLTPAKRRALARARADIRGLQRIEAPMQTFSQRGAPHQEQLTGKFILDVGSGHLPLALYSNLIHRAKAATRLCGDCSTGLETVEPVLGTRAHPRCG